VFEFLYTAADGFVSLIENRVFFVKRVVDKLVQSKSGNSTTLVCTENGGLIDAQGENVSRLELVEGVIE